MSTVYVISADWTLRASVRAELREMGIEALGMETPEDAAQAAVAGKGPDVVVLEASSATTTPGALGWLARGVPVVVVASRAVPVPGIENAAAVLYRPLRVGDVVERVKALLGGTEA